MSPGLGAVDKRTASIVACLPSYSRKCVRAWSVRAGHALAGRHGRFESTISGRLKALLRGEQRMFAEEREFLLDMDSEIDGGRGAEIIYAMVLRHLLNHVVDPRDSARGIIFSLESRLKELEGN